MLTAIETINPFVRPPWWTSSIATHVESTKEAAKRYHDEMTYQPNTVCIYTDGSGIDGAIGAAAYSPTVAKTQYQYLGNEASFNVFAAELMAMNLAIDMLKNNTEANSTNCIIYSDSQASISAITKPAKQSGQGIIREILDKVDSLQAQTQINITIVWIPGHMDIPGNEEADAAAKSAAKEKGKLDASAFKHPAMKSARITSINAASKAEWIQLWQKTKTANQLRKICTRPTAESGIKLYGGISNRRDAAALVRLRTGHCSLNQYLHRFGIEDDPRCNCGDGIVETVKHFLLHCDKYERLRDKLRKKVGAGNMRMEKLLGSPEHIIEALEFIKKTGRFAFN